MVRGGEERAHAEVRPVARAEENLERPAVHIDGPELRRGCLVHAEETAREHLLELGGVQGGEGLAVDDQEVVVVAQDAVVGEIRRAGEDEAAVDDPELVVHDPVARPTQGQRHAGLPQRHVASVLHLVAVADEADGDAPLGHLDRRVVDALPIGLVETEVDRRFGGQDGVRELVVELGVLASSRHRSRAREEDLHRAVGGLVGQPGRLPRRRRAGIVRLDRLAPLPARERCVRARLDVRRAAPRQQTRAEQESRDDQIDGLPAHRRTSAPGQKRPVSAPP